MKPAPSAPTSARHAIRAELLFDGTAFLRDRVVVIEAGHIAGVITGAAPDGIPVTDLADTSILAPGFVDLQVNGGGGVLLNSAQDTATLARIAAAHRGFGTTSLMSTLISGSDAQIRAALAATGEAVTDALPGILGLHLEGPFLASARRGIHPADSIRAISESDLALLTKYRDHKLILTLAPEFTSPEAIAQLSGAGIVVFAGHTEASSEQAEAAFAAGLRGATHLFNAMSQMAGRAPGLVGAVLGHSAAMAGIILDGHHVHSTSARAAYAALGPGRLVLVSDAMASIGSETSCFLLGETEIRRDGDRLAGPDGTLAGAHLTLDQAVRNAVRMLGIPLADALRMATSTPAEAIGQHSIGRIAKGARADLLELGPDVSLRRIWQGGVPCPVSHRTD